MNLDLVRRREDAQRIFSRLAGQAEREGCELLALRMRRLGWNVGCRGFTPTPPALARRLELRMPRLLAQAKADPQKSFIELMPCPRRKRRKEI